MVEFGLVGKNISYSFSKKYFTHKFLELGLNDCSYENFDLATIEQFSTLLRSRPGLKGLNVTIPYKEAIIPFLDDLDPEAARIGAVNTIRISPRGLTGFNTDAYGFRRSLEPMLQPQHTKALILGTGGASKAVAYVLDTLAISFSYVSRRGTQGLFAYEDLTPDIMDTHTVIINCTPLGTYPNIDEKPALPYSRIGERHLLFDLIYNPAKTAFLKEGEKHGAQILNGLRMLELQAEKAWAIWNS